MTGRADRAESMLLALSTFFRTEPVARPDRRRHAWPRRSPCSGSISTSRRSRFPDRLQVEIDVPDGARAGARCRRLILQPIVENAIKYGVSQTRDKVDADDRGARSRPGPHVTIEISNTLAAAARTSCRRATHEGTGVGLANVCQRLDARFGTPRQLPLWPDDRRRLSRSR